MRLKLFIVYEYIKYWFKAKGLHGVHSPFVTSFIQEVLKPNLPKEDKIKVNNYKNVLLINNEIIEVNDLGAGSKKLTKYRKVSDVFKISSSKMKFGKLLFNLAKFQKSKVIIEFGTSLGFGTLHLQNGANESHVISIEGCKNTYAFTKNHFPLGPKTELKLSTFQDYIDKNLNAIKTSKLIFIDGHHDGDFLNLYLDQIDNYIQDDTMIVIDDIRWSQSMFTTWKNLIECEKYHVTIDLFRMGILIKKPTQQKEHFVLRY